MRQLEDAILKSEFRVIKKLLAREKLPKSLFMMFSLLIFDAQGKPVRYVRLIEYGTATGLGHIWTSRLNAVNDILHVVDYQFSSDTLDSIRNTGQSRNLPSDVTECVRSWEAVCAIDMDPALCFQSAFFVSSKHSVASKTFNCDASFLNTLLSELAQCTQQFNLNMSFLQAQPFSVVVPLAQQFHLVNCLPPQFVHYPFTNGSDTWSRLSVKQSIIDGSFPETMRKHEIMKPGGPKKTPSLNSGGETESLRRRRSHNSLPTVLLSMKQQLINQGFFRIIEKTSLRTTVLWNSYDACTGVSSYFSHSIRIVPELTSVSHID
jgi:hypothetical protein